MNDKMELAKGLFSGEESSRETERGEGGRINNGRMRVGPVEGRAGVAELRTKLQYGRR